MGEDPGRHVFAIVVDGVAAGTVAVSSGAGNDVGWVWYWLDAERRGRGLASRALARLCEWAFDPAGGRLRRLELGYRVNNPASGAVAARAGFLVEGREREKFVIDGLAIDVQTAARLRDAPAPELDVSTVRLEPRRPRDWRELL